MSSIQATISSETGLEKEKQKQEATPDSTCPLCGHGEASDFLTAPDRFHLRRELYHLRRCAGCACVWLASPPKPEEMGFHYGEDYHKTIVSGGEQFAAKRWQSERELIGSYKSGGAILDIGCSSGGFLSTMERGAWQLYGIEMDEATAARARSATGGNIFAGDAMDAPFAPESFDVITCFDVLEHVYDPRQFLAKIRRWLKPGGIWCTILPNIDSWESRIFGSYWYGLELPRHTFHFSPRSLRNLMADLGFEEGSVNTAPRSYIERSAGYVGTELLERFGFTPTSQAKAVRHGIPSRVVRKAMRLAVIEPFGRVASWAGAGASMDAVFVKPVVQTNNVGRRNGVD